MTCAAPRPNAVEQQVHVRHILMKTNELADDATVQQKLMALRERIQRGEDFAVLAQTNSEDPGSASEGGDLGWTGPGAFDPEFEKVIDGLKDGEISEPFKTQFGWHIVQVLGRRDFDNTDGAAAPARVRCDPRQQGGRGDRAVAAAPAR